MRVDTWPLVKGNAALYTEDASVARAAGLKPFGYYYDRQGNMFARQFCGPAEAVKRVRAEARHLPEEPILRCTGGEKSRNAGPRNKGVHLQEMRAGA